MNPFTGGEKGITLTELLITVAILGVAALGLMGAFKGIQESIQGSKGKSLAVNLAQEKMESLKNLSYFRLMVTTTTATDSHFTPSMVYDIGYNSPETVTAGGISYTRRLYIRKVQESSGNLVYKNWNDPDTGLKEVLVYTVWQGGSAWKKLELRNLRDDPNRLPTNATFSGTATSGGAPLQDVTVETNQNSSWSDLTDASGNYSFQVAAGSYTLKASKFGYFSSFSAQQSIANEAVIDVDFNLVRMDSGTLSGNAYLRDHLVISQVVSSTESAGNDQEYVELMNPTTWSWTINDAAFDLRYVDQNNVTVTDIGLVFNTTTISSGGYYLIASTGTILSAGTAVAADAVYSAAGSDIIRKNKAGGIIISNDAGTTVWDRVAWSKNAAGAGETPEAPSQATEGTGVNLTNGLGSSEQIIRSSESFASLNPASGTNAWDSNNNGSDFNQGASPQDRSLTFAPHNSGTSYTPKGGTPAAGALVSANDGLSSPVTAGASGSFSLVSVATGSWVLSVSSNAFYQEASGVNVLANTTTPVGNIILSSTATNGYVSGNVVNASNAPLSGILIAAADVQVYTDSLGNYRLAVSTGTQEVVANLNNANPSYVSASQTVTVNLGQVTSNVDFVLSAGGVLTGFVSTNGVDPLPGVAVTASLSGLVRGSDLSKSDGRFTIVDLPTGLYTVVAYPTAGESASPASASQSVSTAQTVFVATFTVSNARGEVTGNLTYAGAPITTGVTVAVSTATIPNDPPEIDSTLRSSSAFYYLASSSADGSYAVSIPGGYTYNVYAWHTTWNGTAPTMTKKSATAAVAAGGTATVNFAWP